MRASTILVCAFLVAAVSASAQTCGEPAVPDGSNRLYDRGWIRSDTVLYGTDARGVFKLRLGANAIERIGEHDAGPPEQVRLSPKRRWLEYESMAPFEYWLYDSGNGRERGIDVHSAGGVEFQFSPDETRLAWLERNQSEHRLAVADLNSFETRSFRLPAAPDPKAVFFDLLWSRAGDSLTYAWRDAERQEFFSVDAVTGAVKTIPAPREFGADEFVESSYLQGDGAAPGEGIARRPVRAGKDSIALERGANVRYANGKIVVSIPGKRPLAIAEPAAGCEPSLSLLDAFEGRYILFRMNGVYWIYGVRENRKAILFAGPDSLDW
jgi:hypothetical protein